VGALGAGILAAITVPARAAEVGGTTLDFSTLIQSLLAGDLLRYGQHGDHTWLVGALIGLALIGSWCLWQRGPRAALLLCVGQVLLPLAAFFLVARPLLGIELEAYQSRQFVTLLPALFVLVGAGGGWLLEGVAARLGRRMALSLGLVLTAALIAGSLVGLRRYWAETKSPEGLVARYLVEHFEPGQAVVSLSYSVDAAISFYGPQAPIFTKPLMFPEGLALSDSLSVLLWDWRAIHRFHTLEDVAQYPSRWVVWLAGEQDETAALVAAGCFVVDEASFGPFQVRELENCPVSEATLTAP
jgi:hypothetical protein